MIQHHLTSILVGEAHLASAWIFIDCGEHHIWRPQLSATQQSFVTHFRQVNYKRGLVPPRHKGGIHHHQIRSQLCWDKMQQRCRVWDFITLFLRASCIWRLISWVSIVTCIIAIFHSICSRGNDTRWVSAKKYVDVKLRCWGRTCYNWMQLDETVVCRMSWNCHVVCCMNHLRLSCHVLSTSTMRCAEGWWLVFLWNMSIWNSTTSPMVQRSQEDVWETGNGLHVLQR